MSSPSGGAADSGGATGVPTPMESGGDATTQSGGQGTGGGGTPSPTGLFDPQQIYLAGATTLLRFGAFAPLEHPDAYILGFSQPQAYGALRGGDLIYTSSAGRLFLFVQDPDRTTRMLNDKPLEDNDVQVDTEPCKVAAGQDVTNGVALSLTGPEARLIYACDADRTTWYEDGGVVYSGPLQLYALGYDGFMLTRDVMAALEQEYGVMNLKDGVAVPITGLPENGFTIRAIRAHTDGFHIALQQFNGNLSGDYVSYVELYEVDAKQATATKVGNYPVATGDVEAPAVLGPDDLYYRIDSHNAPDPTTVRSLKVGDMDPVLVFTQTSKSKLAPDGLITGP